MYKIDKIMKKRIRRGILEYLAVGEVIPQILTSGSLHPLCNID
jgi:hypothetical protein